MLSGSVSPSLFGIKNTNRNFDIEESWGKNQFTNAFPVALVCYMESKNIPLIYLKLNQSLTVEKSSLSAEELFGSCPFSKNTYYSFEDSFQPYKRFVHGKVPGIDLVIKNTSDSTCMKAIEIKLTTLPDTTTHTLPENKYGAEIVIRPDTIVYLALSMMSKYENNRNLIHDLFDPVYKKIEDWSNREKLSVYLPEIVSAFNALLSQDMDKQEPFLLQPIWKTEGKSSILSHNCFDVFVWSDYGFTRLFIDSLNANNYKIDRNARTLIWLFLMLNEFSENGIVDFNRIIDTYTYKLKNDKAFSTSGNKTNSYMACDELTSPRILKTEVKNIVCGGGERYLSPERRLDSCLQINSNLFQ